MFFKDKIINKSYNGIRIKICNGTWLANLLSKVCKRNVITIGKTIYFKKGTYDYSLLQYETCRLLQRIKFGFFKFLIKNIYYNFKFGSYLNPLMVETRNLAPSIRIEE